MRTLHLQMLLYPRGKFAGMVFLRRHLTGVKVRLETAPTCPEKQKRRAKRKENERWHSESSRGDALKADLECVNWWGETGVGVSRASAFDF